MTKKLFLTGASGYVGGELLHQLLELDAVNITSLARNENQADKLPTRTVIGNLDSHDLLVEESRKADIIINTANADHPGIFSILEGARKDALVIHISGAGNLIDPERHGLSNLNVVSDIDVTAIKSLPESRHHVNIERKLFETDKHLVVLSPGVILGSGHGRESWFTSTVFDAFTQHGVFQIGDGVSIWGWTSVGDVARAIVFVIMNREKISKGIHYCWVGSGEVAFHERATHAAERFKREGLLKDNQVKKLNLDELKELDLHPIVFSVVATSSRYEAKKLEQWGFEPKDKDWRVLVSQGKSV